MYVVVGGAQYREDEVVIQLDIIEAAPLEDNLISIDADGMAKAIDDYGKVALYGIYFDFDKAAILPSSKPALEQIAALLKKRPSLNLYVVGHTDMKGSLTYNISLSEKRAEAVVKESRLNLITFLTSRLTAQGVGPLVPVRTNQQDAGRAKNRRVELVER